MGSKLLFKKTIIQVLHYPKRLGKKWIYVIFIYKNELWKTILCKSLGRGLGVSWENSIQKLWIGNNGDTKTKVPQIVYCKIMPQFNLMQIFFGSTSMISILGGVALICGNIVKLQWGLLFESISNLNSLEEESFVKEFRKLAETHFNHNENYM